MITPMQRTLIYITHARVPSDKTPSPFILKTCEGFVKEGYAVELWVANRRGVLNVDPFEYHGIKTRFPIVHISCIDLIGFTGKLGFPLMVLTYNVSLWWKLLRRKEAIVYAHDTRDVILAAFLKHPLFIEAHDFYDSSFGFINRIVVPRVKGWIVTNRIKVQKMHEKQGVPLTHMLYQSNTVDFEAFAIPVSKEEAREKLSLPKEQKIVMYTGHLYPWKGVYTLVEAAHYLPEDTAVYLVGGTDHDRVALKEYVAQKSLPRIHFFPHQPHTLMPLYQKAADVLVLPNTAKEDVSKYETSPVKLFEYLASGRPIVASDIPSIRDIVSEKEVLFAKADDAQDLARAIQESLQSDAAAQARIDAAKDIARAHTWDSRARNIHTFISNHL